MLRISEIRLNIEHTDDDLKQAIMAKLHGAEECFRGYTIVRRAIDARNKSRIVFVYIVDVDVTDEDAVLAKIDARNVSLTPEFNYGFFIPDSSYSFQKRPVIVGSGPAGIFAALALAERGARPIVLERGEEVDQRLKDIRAFLSGGPFSARSNVHFGEGGAGTFSDGKLYTLINDIRTKRVFDEFVRAGAPKEILINAKPHIGTDNLRKVVKSVRTRITDLGGEIRFKSMLTNLIVENRICRGVIVNDIEQIETDTVIIAIGASARDTIEMLHHHGIHMSPKPFSIGLRIEHPQQMIDQAQYGAFASHSALGPAEYKLVHHSSTKRSAYTFCMCPGGIVVAAASEEGGVVTNGMSEYARDRENANSAIVVAVGPEDFESDQALSGICFQRKWEQKAFMAGGNNYFAPVQLVADFIQGCASTNLGSVRPSYQPGVTLADLNLCLPDFVRATLKEALRVFDRKVHGFGMSDAILTGVETRTSSPVRMDRSTSFESSIAGIYPIGEGAGYAGGIVSAAVDGIKVVEAITRAPV